MLEAIDIRKSFNGTATSVDALRGVSLRVGEGEFVALAGRSGSGKSTMLNVLSTLLRPDTGELWYQGQDLAGAPGRELNRIRRSEFAMIFQSHCLMPYLTAEENVLLPKARNIRGIKRDDKLLAAKCLERVGLEGKGTRLPGELSGGEQQRVAIARALASDARILFADEPTGSLDKGTGDTIMELLMNLPKTGMSVVLVTHEPGYAAMAQRTLNMADGLVL